MEINPETGNITVILPKGIKSALDNCISNNPPQFGVKYHISHFYYIIAKIYNISSSKKFKNLDKVPISSTILMNELGRHYKKYLTYLINNGFIETDNHYIVSKPCISGKCKCYGIVMPYKFEKRWEFCEISNKTILHNYTKWKEKNFSSIADDEMLSKLFEMTNKFEVDIESAKVYLEKLKEREDIDDMWIKREIKKCMRINDKNENAMVKLKYIVKDPYNRVHTNLTNLSKHIRENFLYLNGEKVKSIDITSSQASLLYLMIQKYLDDMLEETKNPMYPLKMKYGSYTGYRPLIDIREKYTNFNNHIHGESVFTEFSCTGEIDMHTFGYDTHAELMDVAKVEMKKFEAVLKNGIYEFFMYQWRNRYGSIDRDEMKSRWIKFVFGSPDKVSIRMRRIWEDIFPLITKIIDHFKRNDYRKLAHKLQKTEADLVFNKVCTEIDDKLGIAYATIHDSLMVPVSKYDEAKEIFSNVLIENGIVTGVK